LTRYIGHRRMQREFLTRGLASAAKAKRAGRYVDANTVLQKLQRRLDVNLSLPNSTVLITSCPFLIPLRLCSLPRERVGDEGGEAHPKRGD
jgi:hypothetical protein